MPLSTVFQLYRDGEQQCKIAKTMNIPFKTKGSFFTYFESVLQLSEYVFSQENR
jgi:hypothetical protein